MDGGASAGWLSQDRCKHHDHKRAFAQPVTLPKQKLLAWYNGKSRPNPHAHASLQFIASRPVWKVAGTGRYRRPAP